MRNLILSLNRYQVVMLIACVVLLLGIFRAVSIFAGLSRAGGADLTFASQRTIALPAEEAETFAKIGRTAARDPFAATSRWREPQAEMLEPPPLGDILALQPTPLLLRQDALPRIGAVPGTSEKAPDRELLTRVRRVFPQGVKEPAAPKEGSPASTPGAPAPGAEPPKEGAAEPAKEGAAEPAKEPAASGGEETQQ